MRTKVIKLTKAEWTIIIFSLITLSWNGKGMIF